MTKLREPHVSQLVHYVSRGSADGAFKPMCRAAVVAEIGAWVDINTDQRNSGGWMDSADGLRHRKIEEVWDKNAVALVVHNPSGQFFNVCQRDEPVGKAASSERVEYRPGTWHSTKSCRETL